MHVYLCFLLLFLRIARPPRSPRTAPLFPYTTLSLSPGPSVRVAHADHSLLRCARRSPRSAITRRTVPPMIAAKPAITGCRPPTWRRWSRGSRGACRCDRKRVGEGKGGAVRVDHGGRRMINKKNQYNLYVNERNRN